MRIGIIGGGNMGRALAQALLRNGLAPDRISVADPSVAVRRALAADLGLRAEADNLAAVTATDLVIVAVKPQEMAQVLAPLGSALRATRPVVLSVAAGIRCADIQAWCGPGVPVVRSMPNRPALLGAAATALYAAPDVAPECRERAAKVMGAAGTVVWIEDESLMDVVTALSGSGPAYFFLVAEAMAAAAVRLGLRRPDAQLLAIATLHGAGLMAHASAEPHESLLAGLRDAVTSKGGTTEAALRVLEERGLQQTLFEAMAAATARSRELAARFGSGPPESGRGERTA
jgi:pyrroline-5-carboxylate reductase